MEITGGAQKKEGLILKKKAPAPPSLWARGGVAAGKKHQLYGGKKSGERKKGNGPKKQTPKNHAGLGTSGRKEKGGKTADMRGLTKWGCGMALRPKLPGPRATRGEKRGQGVTCDMATERDGKNGG